MQENASLQPYNTFGIDHKARKLLSVERAEQLKDLLKKEDVEDLLFLGGGSNILLTKDVAKTVVLNRIRGIDIISETETEVQVQAGAGEVWHDFVQWCIQHNFGGLENLSLIPGSVGAAPMQNIGAYGVEIKRNFVSLEALELSTGKTTIFNNEECAFGYRESVFKRALKGQFFITSVRFRLSKMNHELNTSYGAIEQELKEMQATPSIQSISEAVIRIRSSKLPDPKKIGNSGSFFKNPVIDNETFSEIKKQHPTIVHYPAGEGLTKVAAGWLIDQAGWKGKTFGNYGVHKHQALVLVNYGGASGQEIYQLSEDIIKDIQTKFNITLEREVNILN